MKRSSVLPNPRLFILAGEPSGDRIGADLVRRLAVRGEVAGIGGAELEREGLKSLFPMSDLSVMGVTDVVTRLPLLLRRVRETAAAVQAFDPQVAVFIDSQVFCQSVAARLRRAGFSGKLLLYVAPSVWAHRPKRARAIGKLYDEVLAVLPFEPAVMRELGGPPTSYVGHPALARHPFRPEQPGRGPLLLLPGSREGELRRHLPMMGAVAAELAGHPRVDGFVLLTTERLRGRVAEAVTHWPVPARVVADADERRLAFDTAVAASAVSGTVTLELALAGVPMAITYVGDFVQALWWRTHDLRFIGLPNILCGEALVPEVLAARPEPAPLVAALRALLDTLGGDIAQRVGFARLRAEMERGRPEAPIVDPVARVLAHFGELRRPPAE